MKRAATRNPPRQDRSSASITAILDAAEATFSERGFDASTMAAVAERSGMSIGRIYYWFETKDAIARGLAERNEQLIVTVFADMLVEDEAMSTPELVRSIVAQTLSIARSNPSILMQLDPVASPEGDEGALASVVHAGVRALVMGRVPGTSENEATVVASTIINTVVGGLRAVIGADPARAEALTTELVYLASAYLACRFPATENPSMVVGPARSARPTTPVPDVPLAPYAPLGES